MDVDVYNDTYTKFTKSLSLPTSTVLEVDCGPGNVTRYILSKEPALEWLGIDIAPNMIQLAQHYNPRAVFLEMDGRKIRSLDAAFDGIICGFFLPYIYAKEVQTFIADCHKILNSQGILYLSFVDGDPETSDYIKNSQGDQIFFYYHREAQLNKLLKDLGFLLHDCIPVTYTRKDGCTEVHTVIIAQKTI
ncbi:MAG: ubiquinone/menaquinone biosynthesis C-methylase UbiE [Flavobacteriales bacterium]|jgi:ubiquinone/menaquinone biosynthesis C-methylase UbiE